MYAIHTHKHTHTHKVTGNRMLHLVYMCDISDLIMTAALTHCYLRLRKNHDFLITDQRPAILVIVGCDEVLADQGDVILVIVG